jgi:cell division protein FtsI/penicillin-binding protein 2
MKKVSLRSYFALVLAVVLTLGLAVFTVKYFVKAGDWIVFSGSPHVYTGANLNCGIVKDRDGNTLLNATDGRVYSQNVETRTSTLHLIGDRSGFINAPLLGHFADKLIGYDKVNGTYTLLGHKITASLTISASVQSAALKALEGRSGTVGIYNYKTGEILCAVSSPSYDPDNVPDIQNDKTGAYSGVYINRFFEAVYTPGSIMKLLTSTAAIETIPDIYQQKFQCAGSSIIGGQKINCNGVHGTIDFSNALAQSCNCTFGAISTEVGAKTLQSYADKLGITSSFSCDGYETAAGHYDLSSAEEGDVAWAGIGQYTDQVNAYAYMRFMGILGGGGEAAEPYLMKSIQNGLIQTYTAQTKTTGQLLNPVTAQKMATMMHYNVVTIYGENQFPPYYACAKSGTAEQDGKKANAMFAGFLKDDTYPLAFVVFIENAGSGSGQAAPVASAALNAAVAEMSKTANKKP